MIQLPLGPDEGALGGVGVTPLPVDVSVGTCAALTDIALIRGRFWEIDLRKPRIGRTTIGGIAADVLSS